jgi:arginyl-tRNA synthetase
VATAPAIHSPEERDLVLQLACRLEPIVAWVRKTSARPNMLCDYAFELGAERFSRFYSAHHIMSETDTNLRSSRLGLCASTLGF